MIYQSESELQEKKLLFGKFGVLTAEEEGAEHQSSSRRPPEPIHSPHGRSHPLWSDSVQPAGLCEKVKKEASVSGGEWGSEGASERGRE